MADGTKLISLVENSADIFAADHPEPQQFEEIISELNLLLLDTEGLPAEVVDHVWQGAKQLRNALAAEKGPDPDALGQIFARLTAAADALQETPEAAAEEEEAAEENYTIPDDDVPLIEDFVTEASEHLEAAEGAMLELETHQEDQDTLNLLFRSFHTIKGMAGFMNLAQVGAVSHDAENLLDLARKGELLLCGNNADAIFRAIDMLKGMVEAIREAIEGDCVVAPFAGMTELVTFIRSCAEGRADAEPPAPASSEPQAAAEEPPAPAPSEPQAAAEEPPAPAPPEPKKAPAETAAPKKSGSQIDEKIKVSTSRLDSLVNMVGELVIAQLMVTESLKASMDGNADLLRNTTHQSKIIRELQELSMSMRMVPVSGIFQKMARMSRDLSRQAGKQLNFVMVGEQTELDRTIVDKLADPLIHMIRNSVDHGIEPPDERQAAGKPPAGRVELRAFHLAGNIVIEIEDDGRGLNKQKLLDKAISRGVVAADKKLLDPEIFSLIFNPGLSTAEKVTSVSGRGVGMDVVKRNIEALRGRIDIDSVEGKGTVFTITLPLTLAIIDGQVVRVGDEKYIIPINTISNSFRPSCEQVSTVQGQREMVMERSRLLPLVRLHELFGISPDSDKAEEGLVVIVEEDSQACCLLVDELLDQQQVVIKSLGDFISSAEGISGGAIMGDGMVSLILDIPGIIKLYKN